MSILEMLRPLAGGRMSAEIVGQILPLIRGGQLRPGDRFPSERELSQTFGVSRVTVREAMRVLEVMGLVEVRVGSSGGAYVTAPSSDIVGEGLANILAIRGVEPVQLAESRALIELAILDLVIVRIAEEEIDLLREMCREAKARAEAGTYDPRLSVAFHTRLAQCSNNDAVSLLAESFPGPLSMGDLRATEEWEQRALVTVEEHTKLVEAIAERDAARARTVLRNHLLRNLDLPGQRAPVEGEHDDGRLTYLLDRPGAATGPE